MTLKERAEAMTIEAGLALLATEVAEMQEYLNKADEVFDKIHAFKTETEKAITKLSKTQTMAVTRISQIARQVEELQRWVAGLNTRLGAVELKE